MNALRSKMSLIITLLFAAFVFFVLYRAVTHSNNIKGVVAPVLKFPQANQESYAVPPFSGSEYKNERFRFTLQLPDGFRAQELAPDERGGIAIVLQNSRGDGIQIYVTPDSGRNTVLRASDIRAAIPDMSVTNESQVEVGEYNTGVAFMSDNEAFGGASREVWFYFRNNLYQISTYEHLDPLLQAMFATWQFYL